MNAADILTVCNRNPIRDPRPATTASWTVYRFERNSEGDLDRTETGHEFTNYRDAETYAEGLNNSTDVTERFWFEAGEDES